MIETDQQFGAERVEPEKENMESDASRKRKWDCDGEMEAESDGQMSAKRHKSMIETYQQFGAESLEPEK